MPYINDDLLKDDEQNQQQISSGSGVIGEGGAPQQAPGANKGSGQFANLDEYLRVNKPQGFGEQLASKVGEDVGKAGESVAQTGDEFKSRVDNSTIQNNPDLISRAVNDSTNFVNDDGNVDSWNKLFNAKYQGPSQFQDAQDLYNRSTGATQTAVGKAGASKSEAGRFALLDSYFGKPTYTPGQKSLDNLLVQNDEKANEAFDTVQKNAAALADQEKNQTKELGDYGLKGKTTTEATRGAARGAIGVDEGGNLTPGNPIEKELNILNSRAQRDAGNNAATLALFQGRAANRQVTPGEAEQMGISGGTRLFDINPADSKYYSGIANPTVNQEATPENQARINALSKLAGVDNTFLTGDVGGYDRSQGVKFNKDLFQRDLLAANTAYQKEAGSLIAQIQENERHLNPPRPGEENLGQLYHDDLVRKLKAIQDKYGYNNMLGIKS